MPLPQPVAVQLLSQPSPSSALPSSHSSPPSTMPLPQPVDGAVVGAGVAVVGVAVVALLAAARRRSCRRRSARPRVPQAAVAVVGVAIVARLAAALDEAVAAEGGLTRDRAAAVIAHLAIGFAVATGLGGAVAVVAVLAVLLLGLHADRLAHRPAIGDRRIARVVRHVGTGRSIGQAADLSPPPTRTAADEEFVEPSQPKYGTGGGPITEQDAVTQVAEIDGTFEQGGLQGQRASRQPYRSFSTALNVFMRPPKDPTIPASSSFGTSRSSNHGVSHAGADPHRCGRQAYQRASASRSQTPTAANPKRTTHPQAAHDRDPQ